MKKEDFEKQYFNPTLQIEKLKMMIEYLCTKKEKEMFVSYLENLKPPEKGLVTLQNNFLQFNAPVVHFLNGQRTLDFYLNALQQSFEFKLNKFREKTETAGYQFYRPENQWFLYSNPICNAQNIFWESGLCSLGTNWPQGKFFAVCSLLICCPDFFKNEVENVFFNAQGVVGYDKKNKRTNNEAIGLLYTAKTNSFSFQYRCNPVEEF